jgi:hypothetical protein
VNRTEVLEQLEPICHTKVRQVEHTPRTRVLVEPGQVVIRPGTGGQLVPLSENGVKAMTNFVGLPRKICQELSPDLFGRVATELLGRKERYNLLLEGDDVQDFVEYRGVRNVPVERVLSTIERAIPRCDYHRVTVLPNYVATLEIIGTKQEAVRRGDLVRAGAMVSFSPISTVMPVVQSYVCGWFAPMVRPARRCSPTSLVAVGKEMTSGSGSGSLSTQPTSLWELS